MQERFMRAIQELDTLLRETETGKIKLSLTLKDLAQLHHLQSRLQECKFLNSIYSEESRIKQYLSRAVTVNLQIQEELCSIIETKMESITSNFNHLDKLILYILNQTMNKTTMKNVLRQISNIILGSNNFTLLRFQEKSVESVSTDEFIEQQLTEQQKLQLYQQFRGDQLEIITFQPTGQLQQIFKCSSLQVIRVPQKLNAQTHSSLIIYEAQQQAKLPQSKPHQIKLICDQLITIGYDYLNENYHKDDLINSVRAIGQFLIKNAPILFQECIRNEIERILNTKCEIIQSTKHSKDTSFAILENQTKCFIPVMSNHVVQFYLHMENVSLDIITFADFMSQLWQHFKHSLRELKDKEFLYQIIEVSTPTKLVIASDLHLNIIYQSGSVPSSWNFLDLSNQLIDCYQNLTEIKMEEIYKTMLLSSLEEVQKSKKGAIDAGQIIYHDKYVDIAIYVKKDEKNEINQFFIVFDQPKKRFESQRQSKSEIKVSETLASLKQEKIEKACLVLQESLNLNLQTDEIIDMLKEHALMTIIEQKEQITEDIRQTYVLEYYRNSEQVQTYRRTISEPDTPFATKTLIQEQQLTNAKKMELFQLRPDDLENLGNWCFDITVQKDQIKHYTWALFHLLNYFDKYQMYKETFFQFLVAIEERYNSRRNPFHNFEHGFTVAHACYYMIKNKLLDEYLDQTEQFAAILSSLCHDIDHTGRTNGFEVARMSKLAVRYNDESVLENHHAAMTFKIMQREKYNILSNLSQEQFQKVRRFMVSNILATDMKKHFDLVSSFEIKYKNGEMNIVNMETKRVLSGLIVHTCDLTQPTKRFEITKKWSIRIQNEFDNQVEEERLLGLPVTQHLVCQNLPKQELSFIRNIIQPLYVLTSSILNNGLSVALKCLEENEKEWTKLLN
ncbi:unnamed protein product [Paramecium octaurelia]|uniref:Phosphodiesterase n=1 Tax=Paramecium octaurelia TaxID=43137 RepID=A0A8S1SXV0_PAROT|nr:unnamed protein product [Paramecium octaurelia]